MKNYYDDLQNFMNEEKEYKKSCKELKILIFAGVLVCLSGCSLSGKAYSDDFNNYVEFRTATEELDKDSTEYKKLEREYDDESLKSYIKIISLGGIGMLGGAFAFGFTDELIGDIIEHKRKEKELLK